MEFSPDDAVNTLIAEAMLTDEVWQANHPILPPYVASDKRED